MMRWQDVSTLNRKWSQTWLAGLGGGVFEGGNVLLPKSGVGQAEPPGGSLFWWNIQVNANDQLDQLGREQVELTEKPDVPTCAAVQWLLRHMPDDAYFREFLETPENRQLVAAGCAAATEGLETIPVPKLAGGGEPPPEPEPSPPPPADTAPVDVGACSGGTCDCYVYEGDQGEHIAFFQAELNEALIRAGYEPIEETGVYDAATCGAVFELGGRFKPTYPAICDNVEGEWLVPLECPDMVLPRQAGEAKSSKAGMFAIGGLLLAAGVGTAYWVSRR